jgi:cytoskeletal protein RodZ
MNFSWCIWLKQHRIAVEGVLWVIAITACNAPAKSQPPFANTPSVASPSIASTATLSPTSPTQSNSSSPPSPVSPIRSATNVGSLQQEAVQVIRDYYTAIARRDYKQAYSAWEGGGAASHQSFKQFKQGFANTASVAVEVGEPGRLDPAAGSSYIEIPVTITAVTKNGTRQRFRGSYVLRRVNNVPGSSPDQRRWHLYSANITQVN